MKGGECLSEAKTERKARITVRTKVRPAEGPA
jgi:hypothetical protein